LIVAPETCATGQTSPKLKTPCVSRELRVAVEDEEPLRLVESPSFAQLQYDPQSVWLTGHIAVQNLPPVVANDKEAVQNSEGQGRHGEEIHGSDCFAMVPEKKPASAALEQDRGSPSSPSEKPFVQKRRNPV
jgi:hypothetical protein